jgi:hypothetical protein
MHGVAIQPAATRTARPQHDSACAIGDELPNFRFDHLTIARWCATTQTDDRC